MLAKRARNICPKHFKLWEKVYFQRLFFRQICDEITHELLTRGKVELNLMELSR